MSIFSFHRFEEMLFLSSKSKLYNYVFDTYDHHIKVLEDGERPATSTGFDTSKKSLLKFHKRTDLRFADITPEWLYKYERWMLCQNYSISTVGNYIRSLRRLFNLSISKGNLPKEYYPFGLDKYIIPATVNLKRALSFEQVNQIYHYKCSNPTMEFYRDIWMFSYLAQGINFKDISNLKWSDARR